MNRATVRVKDGYLIATPSTDPNYPGIDIEFIADNDNGQHCSRPRVLMEKPVEDGNLRVLIWNNKNSEDYTEEIEFE